MPLKSSRKFTRIKRFSVASKRKRTQSVTLVSNDEKSSRLVIHTHPAVIEEDVGRIHIEYQPAAFPSKPFNIDSSPDQKEKDNTDEADVMSIEDLSMEDFNLSEDEDIGEEGCHQLDQQSSSVAEANHSLEYHSGASTPIHVQDAPGANASTCTCPGSTLVKWSMLDESVQSYIFDSLLAESRDFIDIAKRLHLTSQDMAAAIYLWGQKQKYPLDVDQLYNYCASLGNKEQGFVDPDIMNQHMNYFAFAANFDLTTPEQNHLAFRYLRQVNVQGLFIDSLVQDDPAKWTRPAVPHGIQSNRLGATDMETRDQSRDQDILIAFLFETSLPGRKKNQLGPSRRHSQIDDILKLLSLDYELTMTVERETLGSMKDVIKQVVKKQDIVPAQRQREAIALRALQLLTLLAAEGDNLNVRARYMPISRTERTRRVNSALSEISSKLAKSFAVSVDDILPQITYRTYEDTEPEEGPRQRLQTDRPSKVSKQPARGTKAHRRHYLDRNTQHVSKLELGSEEVRSISSTGHDENMAWTNDSNNQYFDAQSNIDIVTPGSPVRPYYSPINSDAEDEALSPVNQQPLITASDIFWKSTKRRSTPWKSLRKIDRTEATLQIIHAPSEVVQDLSYARQIEFAQGGKTAQCMI